MPSLDLLRINYRTHSGILDAASSVTAAIKRLFPRFLDKVGETGTYA